MHLYSAFPHISANDSYGVNIFKIIDFSKFYRHYTQGNFLLMKSYFYHYDLSKQGFCAVNFKPVKPEMK